MEDMQGIDITVEFRDPTRETFFTRFATDLQTVNGVVTITTGPDTMSWSWPLDVIFVVHQEKR